MYLRVQKYMDVLNKNEHGIIPVRLYCGLDPAGGCEAQRPFRA